MPIPAGGKVRTVGFPCFDVEHLKGTEGPSVGALELVVAHNWASDKDEQEAALSASHTRQLGIFAGLKDEAAHKFESRFDVINRTL